MSYALKPTGLELDNGSYTMTHFSSGTFTPTIIIEGASGGRQATTTYVAKWIRLNGICTVNVAASWSNYYASGGTGAVLFTLPVAFSQNTSNQTEIAGTCGIWGSDNASGQASQNLRFQRTAQTNSTTVYLYYNYSGDAYTYMRVGGNPLGSSSGFLNLNFSFSYACSN